MSQSHVTAACSFAEGAYHVFDIAVVIGRFQPLHQGHEALVKRALALGRQVAVLVGSAHQAPTPRNPFSFSERAAMLKASAPASDRQRLHPLPLRDYYNVERWAQAAVRAVGTLGAPARDAGAPAVLPAPEPAPALLASVATANGPGEAPSVVLVGHVKDASADYRDIFPAWAHDHVDALTLASEATESEPSKAKHDPPLAASTALHPSEAGSIARRIDATWIRQHLIGAAPSLAQGAVTPEQVLAPLTGVCSDKVLNLVAPWLVTDAFHNVAAEAQALRAYKDAWAQAPYAPVFVTTDVLVTSASHVLLVSRDHAPGRGLLALPGGFLEQGERLFASALRELAEETGLHLSTAIARRCLVASHVFDHPHRSQRGRTVTHVFHLALDETAHQELGAPPSGLPTVAAGDDAAEAWWCPKRDLLGLEPRFFEDHFMVLDHFLSLLDGDKATPI